MNKPVVETTPNTYAEGPDDRGFFGIFGGRFVAETLMPLILDLEKPPGAPPRPTRPSTRSIDDAPAQLLCRTAEPALPSRRG